MIHRDSETVQQAKSYLSGESFPQAQLEALWKQLKCKLEFGYARRVLGRYRRGEGIVGAVSSSRDKHEKLCQERALCTSKDPDLSAAIRHDQAIAILGEYFTLDPREEGGRQVEMTGDAETLGIAGGIWKRKWRAFGQIEDLHRSLASYEHGYAQGVQNDYGYTAINAAYLNDLLAHLGDEPAARRKRARAVREDIIENVTPLGEYSDSAWLNNELWYRATLAEAHFGLGQFDEARRLLEQAVELPDTAYWEYETTATQLVELAWLLHGDDGLGKGAVRGVLRVLTGSEEGVGAVFVGKVGLALSGGGFRASFYHLGALARLAELDVLRHVDVLSCVSGGSIVGAAYYLFLRRLLTEPRNRDALTAHHYIDLVARLIEHFESCVASNVRAEVQNDWLGILKNLWSKQGGLDTDLLAQTLDEVFYHPLVDEGQGLYMHAFNVEPADHDPNWRGQGAFNPKRHNWRRAHKVPALVLNATTVNTGHAWQFTTTWMGESPYAIHDEVDAVPRLRRSWYKPSPPAESAREVTVGQAVAASACVPGLFSPVRLPGLYELMSGERLDVLLVDGGVYDNQGTVSLLAQDCNVLIVSDASGQLTVRHDTPTGIKGRLRYAKRSSDVLMERVRIANYADLEARQRSGQLRGLMFLHMKDDLFGEPVDWTGSQERMAMSDATTLTRTGVRRDVQTLLAELRTDLNQFTTEETRYLMACGYQMAGKVFEDTLAQFSGLSGRHQPGEWVFASELEELCSTAEKDREGLLARLRQGGRVQFDPDGE